MLNIKQPHNPTACFKNASIWLLSLSSVLLLVSGCEQTGPEPESAPPEIDGVSVVLPWIILAAEEASAHVEALSRHNCMDSRPIRSPVAETVSQSSLESRQRHWSIREEELTRLNPGVDLEHLGSEQEVVFWKINPNYSGLSVNRPNRGRLYNGELMPSGSGWIVRDERFSFGATQTITGLIGAIRATLAAHEEPGQDLLIADISRRTGGSFPPHSSHQSGRDVDVTYYRNTLDPPTFTRTSNSELDTARTWTFLRTLILDHNIVYAFIDRRLQIQLFLHAERVGEHPAWLAQIFEYGPRGLRNSRGIVREEPGHGDHMHIRFPCTADDIRCRPSYK